MFKSAHLGVKASAEVCLGQRGLRKSIVSCARCQGEPGMPARRGCRCLHWFAKCFKFSAGVLAALHAFSSAFSAARARAGTVPRSQSSDCILYCITAYGPRRCSCIFHRRLILICTFSLDYDCKWNALYDEFYEFLKITAAVSKHVWIAD